MRTALAILGMALASSACSVGSGSGSATGATEAAGLAERRAGYCTRRLLKEIRSTGVARELRYPVEDGVPVVEVVVGWAWSSTDPDARREIAEYLSVCGRVVGPGGEQPSQVRFLAPRSRRLLARYTPRRGYEAFE